MAHCSARFVNSSSTRCFTMGASAADCMSCSTASIAAPSPLSSCTAQEGAFSYPVHTFPAQSTQARCPMVALDQAYAGFQELVARVSKRQSSQLSAACSEKCRHDVAPRPGWPRTAWSMPRGTHPPCCRPSQPAIHDVTHSVSIKEDMLAPPYTSRCQAPLNKDVQMFPEALRSASP